MMAGGASRRRNLAFALVVALLAALAFHWWAGTREAPTELPAVPAPSPQDTASAREQTPPVLHPPSRSSPRSAGQPDATGTVEPPSRPQPTPSIFDFGTMLPPAAPEEDEEEERFVTNEWFTEEHLQHPEIYFEWAERMPELRRPEERRDTLAYFIAYREKLERDLEAAGDNTDRRQQILATIGRYDEAIARLRALIDEERS
jgi:hypothetical protein